MNFTDAITVCFSKYADFSGRARRAEYWWWLLFTVIIGFVVGFVEGFTSPSSKGMGPLSMLLNIGLLLPSCAVTARRLHDVGASGWWQLWFIPAVAIIAVLYGASDTLGAISLVIGILFFVVYFIWLVSQGAVGSNRYGDDPLAEVNAVTADE